MIHFNELSVKERIIFGVGTVVAIFLLYLSLFLLPALKNISDARKDLNKRIQQWAELQSLVEENANLPTSSAPPERVSLLAFLEQSGNSLNISNKIVYLKPLTTTEKGESAEVKIDNVTGEELMRFLHRIQQAQIKITQINLRDHNLDGLWTVKMFLED